MAFVTLINGVWSDIIADKDRHHENGETEDEGIDRASRRAGGCGRASIGESLGLGENLIGLAQGGFRRGFRGPRLFEDLLRGIGHRVRRRPFAPPPYFG
jgi:hypothetical protein